MAAPAPLLGRSHEGWSLSGGFRRALERPHALRRAVVSLLLLGAAYAFAILLLAVGGGTPGSAPLLPISRSSYFYVESAFTLPVIVGAALLAAWVAHGLSTWLGARVERSALVVTVVRATWMATLCSLVPDLIMGATTALGLFDGAQVADDLVHPTGLRVVLWTYLALYVLAFLVLYPVAVRAATGLDRVQSVAVGWAAFAVYQAVLAIFIR